ncbi:NAD-binding protein [bacterium]|nr:NAD-binding protein [bacterium]
MKLRNIKMNALAAFALIFVIVFILSGIGLYCLEHNINKKCENIFDAFWLTTVFLLSGFEEFGPISMGGRFISLFIFILGAALMVLITGHIASVFVYKRFWEAKMPNQYEKHIAICNWNERGDKIINELHAEQAEPDTDIIVVSDKIINEDELRKHKAYEKVYFVKGDPTLHETLKSSRVHLAKSIIILADDDFPDSDAKSALIAIAIKSLMGASENKPHIVAEVINHRKMLHLKDAGVDEIVCSTDYGLGILAQCTLYDRLSEAYEHLLQYTPETNELYIVSGEKFPKAVYNKTFKEACDLLNNNRDPNNPAILLGVRRNDHVILNPMEGWEGEGDKFETFQEGDALIVMAYDLPDLSHWK